MFYEAFKYLVAVFFNVLNRLMFGNLPPFGCVGVVVEEQGRFLVVKRPEGTFVFPGGFMRWRETPEQTAIREGKEETGLDLSIQRLICYRSAPTRHPFYMSTLTLIFQASVIGGTPQSSIEGEPCWLDEETVCNSLDEFYQPALHDYLHSRNQASSSQDTNSANKKKTYAIHTTTDNLS